jgi:hypothetical protein|tara:strand:- start:607 stop:765 length:159 start_codon:yes stop_codon:yes gene_type:complete
MSSFDYEQHIDEMMELKERRAEYDAWMMERELEIERLLFEIEQEAMQEMAAF